MHRSARSSGVDDRTGRVPPLRRVWGSLDDPATPSTSPRRRSTTLLSVSLNTSGPLSTFGIYRNVAKGLWSPVFERPIVSLPPPRFSPMSDPSTGDGQACRSCGLVGTAHGSDAECIAALRSKVDQVNTFVDSLLKQSARRRYSLPAPVAERVEGSVSHRDPSSSVPSNPRLRMLRSTVAIQL